LKRTKTETHSRSGLKKANRVFSIRGKLIAGFLIVLILMLGIFGVAYYSLDYMGKSAEKVARAEREQYLWSNWNSTIQSTIANYEYFFISNNDEWLKSAQSCYESSSQIRNELEQVLDPVHKESFNQISDSVQGIKIMLDSLAENLQNSQSNEFYLSIGIQKIGQTIKTMVTSIDKAVAESELAAQAIAQERENQQKGFTLILIMIASIAALIAICVAVLVPQAISNGITSISKVLKKMATGDLTQKVTIKSSDEIGDMVSSYNDMQKYLSNLVNQLKQNSAQLLSASEQLSVAAKQSSDSTQQVAASSQQMAKGAQEQSNNAQETSKSIEQLSGIIDNLSKGAREQSSGVRKAVESITRVSETMSQVAQNAAQAASGAKQAADSANLGTQKSKLTLSGMEKIKEVSANTAQKIEELGSRSAEIGKIVAVIDDIAAQTNLLALNAAIEAARAGEQGRGFAVVSDEVRKLAERTSSATKEIAELIGSVQKGVQEATKVMTVGNSAVADGYNLALEAGQSLEQIVQAASEVNNRIEQISIKAQQVNSATNELVKVIDSVGNVSEQNTSATEQMSSSALQVSRAIETMAGIAEENSAATEQVSASAQEMSAQVQEIVASSHVLKNMASNLEQSVAMFKIDETASEKLKSPGN